jgi:hypothetical protein
MRKPKVHLEFVDGGVYCGVWTPTMDPEKRLPSTPKLSEVTCLRCLRRYHRYPINYEVKHVFNR